MFLNTIAQRYIWLTGIEVRLLNTCYAGLFLGLWPTLFRDAPFSGFYLLFYTRSKQATMKGNQYFELFRRQMSGGLLLIL